MMTICHHVSILLKPRLRSLQQKARKQILSKKLRLPIFFRFWKILTLNRTNSLTLFTIYQKEFLDVSVSTGLIHSDALALAGDGTPVVTSHRERKNRICKCKENGITDCKCDHCFSQPDCDIGWDSSHDCYYHGYDLYMLVDSQSDLPVFPHFCCTSKHDSHGFLHAFFRMKSFLPDYTVSVVHMLQLYHAAPSCNDWGAAKLNASPPLAPIYCVP